MDINEARQRIIAECDSIKELLLAKNEQYGNAVLEPLGIFSDGNPLGGVNYRIDDKLKRIASKRTDETEDTELDLIGYMIMRRIIVKSQTRPD